MREIKFRAWDTETKEMDYNFLSRNWLKVCIESPYVKLLQYTGLKDKNGKEIYEGDIISGQYNAGTVIFKHGSYQIQWNSNPYDCSYLLTHADEQEVIGNVYENPELLEVTT